MNNRLLAITVSRRCVAAAAYSGVNLDCTFVRELSSNGAKASESARKFALWLLEVYPSSRVVIEQPADGDTRRSDLFHLIRLALEAIHPVALVSGEHVIFAFGEACRTRVEVRQTVATILPLLNDTSRNTAVLDAAALGLYVQTDSFLEN